MWETEMPHLDVLKELEMLVELSTRLPRVNVLVLVQNGGVIYRHMFSNQPPSFFTTT